MFVSKKTLRKFLLITPLMVLLGAPLAHSYSAEEEKIEGQENAILGDAPSVPPAITRSHATKVIVHLEVKEVEARLADGVKYTYWTFGGHVPGKFIRIREGDLVE